MEVQQVNIKMIVPDIDNVRKVATTAADKELVESVKAQGILSALLVRPSKGVKHEFRLVAGHRRLAAALAAGLTTVPCIVKEMTDEEAATAQMVENLQREDLTPLEEAEAFKRMMDVGMTHVDIAAKVAKSRVYVYQRLRLVTLSPKVKKALAAGTLSVNYAIEMLVLPSHAAQEKVLEAVLEDYSKIRNRKDLRKIIGDNQFDLAKAPFSRKDEALVPKAGACLNCAKRTGAQADLLDDTGKVDLCLDGTCYAAKLKAHGAQLVAKFEAEGKTVLCGDEAKKFSPLQRGMTAIHESDFDLAGDGTTWAQALKKAGKEVPTVLVVKEGGQVVEYADEKQMKAALPTKALKDYARPKADAKAGERAKRLVALSAVRAVWPTTWKMVVAKAAAPKLEGEHLRAFLGILVKTITDHRTTKGVKARAGAEPKELLKNAKNDADLRTLAWQMALGGGLDYDDVSLNDQAKMVFKHVGIDWAKMRAEGAAMVEAEKAAKDKAKVENAAIKKPVGKGKK